VERIMGFNLKRSLRRTPAAALRQYFGARGCGLSGYIDWEKPTKAQLDALFDAINSLPQREAVLSELEQIELLCNPIGQRALQSVVARNAHILSLLQCAHSDEARAITLLIEDATLFEQALAASYADNLRFGRSWSAFTIQEATSRGIGLHVPKTLEAGIAAALVRADGTLGKIDSFERASMSEGGELGGLNIQYTVYAEGLPVSDLVFDGDEPTRQTRRPVLEAAIWYDQRANTVDVVSAGGKLVRAKIAKLFANSVLGITDKLSPVVPRRFTLDRLKRPFSGETDASDGIRSAKVILVRIAPAAGTYDRLTIEVDPSDPTDICTVSQRWFGDADPLLRPDWHITQAKLRIVFHPEARSTRDKAVTLELRVPNGSNIREQIRQHQIISRKYLPRWQLVAESVA
jgi:hypothetical protein